MKKSFIIYAFAISLLINAVPLFIFRDALVFSKQSIVSLVIMILVSINGIACYLLRHKGNFLPLGKPRGDALSADKDYTFTKEYKKEFYWQFAVYALSIPFFLPCIFFVSKWEQSLWTLCVAFVPQFIYIVYGISNTVKEAKEYRELKEKQERELKEQEQKEELGRFK